MTEADWVKFREWCKKQWAGWRPDRETLRQWFEYLKVKV
jgi:hypothetical protein